MEVPQRLGAVAVVDQAVERGEQRRAVGHRPVRRVGVRFPTLLRQPHALRAEAALGQDPLRLAERHGLRLGIPALGEIPEPLAVAPADDGDDAACFEDHQHERDLAVAPPGVRVTGSRRVLRDLARQQRPGALELA